MSLKASKAVSSDFDTVPCHLSKKRGWPASVRRRKGWNEREREKDESIK